MTDATENRMIASIKEGDYSIQHEYAPGWYREVFASRDHAAVEEFIDDWATKIDKPIDIRIIKGCRLGLLQIKRYEMQPLAERSF